MPESLPEQIAAALQTRFGAIVGDAGATYWYTVNKCLREPQFHGGCLNDDHDTIYVLSPDVEEKQEEATGSIKSLLRMTLVVASKFRPKSEAPYSSEMPKRATVENRVIRDAEKKLREDVTLGGALNVTNTEATIIDRDVELTYVEGWALGFLRLLVTYHHRYDAP